jgi:predicted transcriptional regulator
VIDMALLSVIRRWHFREEIPIREIERRTGLSRNTIRKYLRGDVPNSVENAKAGVAG